MKKKTKIYPWKMYFHVLLGMFFLLPALLNAQNATVKVSGIVTDTNNEPLIGVSDAEKGTTNGAITDVDGKYSLTVRPTSSLRFSFISYKALEVKEDGRQTINIRMEDDVQALNEVVVIGYGTLDKKELTSAVSHISSKDFLHISSLDPSMMIQGKVAGVSVTNTAAADPHNQASIQIRGISSRAAGLGPLIVIDGIPGGSLTKISPNDIASMDILKDGAASAIYGTRGSNGVIVITTKKGSRDGKFHATYKGMLTASLPLHELDQLTAEEFREIHRTCFSHKPTVTLSGGTSQSNYRCSVDYRNATGIDIRSGREEYGARASINHTTKNGLLDFSVNIAPRIAYRENSSWDAFKIAMDANPTTPLFDPENPHLYSDFTGQEALWNPVEELKLEQNGGETKLLDWDATVKLNLLPLLA